MPQSLSALYCHFVFSTKNREQRISQALGVELYAVIGGIVRERKAALLAAGGIEVHVHLLVSLPRDRSVADMVRDIKSHSGMVQSGGQQGNTLPGDLGQQADETQ